MEAITTIVETIVKFTAALNDGNKDVTGSTAYDLAYVFVKPWTQIADGASQLLGMFV